MARIQQYHSQVSAQTGAPSPMSNPADFGAGMSDLGKSLERVGATIDTAFGKIEAKKERDSNLWVTKALAEGNLHWTEAALKTAENPPPGGEGLTETTKNDFNTWSEKTRAEAVKGGITPSAMERLETGFIGLKTEQISGAMRLEAKLAAAKTMETVSGVLSTYQNAVHLDSSQEPRLVKEGRDFIAAAATGYVDPLNPSAKPREKGLSAGQVETLQKAFTSDMAYKSIEGRVDRANTNAEVNAIKAELQSKERQSTLTPQAFEQVTQHVTNVEKHLAARNEGLAVASIRAASALAETGEHVKTPPLGNVSDPVARAALTRMWDTAQVSGHNARIVRTATPEEYRQIAAGLDAQVSDQTKPPADRLAALEAKSNLVRARQDMVKQFSDDPATYVLKNSAPVSQAYKEWQANPKDEKALANYNGATKAEQTRLGIPPERVNLLTKDQVAQAEVTMSKIPRTADGAEEAYKTVTGIYRAHGEENAALVHRQLVDNKVLSGVDLVASRMTTDSSRSAGINLLRAHAIGDKDMLSKTDAGEQVKKTIESAVQGAAVPLVRTLMATPSGGAAHATDIMSAARTLALYYHTAHGIEPTMAATRATREVGGGNYNYVGSYRVPVRFNHDEVSIGASQILRNVEALDIAIESQSGRKPEDVSAEVKNHIRNTGQWVNDTHEEGLQLIYDNGVAVLNAKTGKPISFTWEELRRVAAESDAQRRADAALQGGQ